MANSNFKRSQQENRKLFSNVYHCLPHFTHELRRRVANLIVGQYLTTIDSEIAATSIREAFASLRMTPHEWCGYVVRVCSQVRAQKLALIKPHLEIFTAAHNGNTLAREDITDGHQSFMYSEFQKLIKLGQVVPGESREYLPSWAA